MSRHMLVLAAALLLSVPVPDAVGAEAVPIAVDVVVAPESVTVMSSIEGTDAAALLETAAGAQERLVAWATEVRSKMAQDFPTVRIVRYQVGYKEIELSLRAAYGETDFLASANRELLARASELQRAMTEGFPELEGTWRVTISRDKQAAGDEPPTEGTASDTPQEPSEPQRAVQGKPRQTLPLDHWAYDAAQRLVGLGMITGWPSGTFHGKRPLTRYEFAYAISRLLDVSETSDSRGSPGPQVPQGKVDCDEVRGTVQKLIDEFAAEIADIYKHHIMMSPGWRVGLDLPFL